MNTASALLDVRQVAGSLGAEIHGVNLHEPVSEELRAALHAAWLEHSVLFFPGQHLSIPEIRAFANIWGQQKAYDTNRLWASDADPNVVQFAASDGGTADYWHSDLTYMPDPPKISILSMTKLPPVGGDTMWSSQFLAYEALSEPMRLLLDGCTATHELAQAFVNLPKHEPRTAQHRVVRVHPETGRRYLYVCKPNTTRIHQLSLGESDAMLQYLFAHCVEPEFSIRYRWTEGTVAVWDNQCTLHRVVSDFVGERTIHRVTVADDGPAEKLDSPWLPYKRTRHSLSSLIENTTAIS